jgi:hypothetical protein
MNDPAKLAYFHEPFPAGDMTMSRARAYANKAGNKGPECLAASVQGELNLG